MLSVDEIHGRVTLLRQQYAARDGRMSDVLAVRRGELHLLFPQAFSEEYPKPMVSNLVDTAARDLAEVIAPLPSINCTAANTVSDRARVFQDKRTKIAAHYVIESRLQVQMFTGADQYLSHGFLPIRVEADLDEKVPRILIEDPVGSYPQYDRWGRVVGFAKRFLKPIVELCAMFPELAPHIQGTWEQGNSNSMLEVVRWDDRDQCVMYLPERKNLVLAKAGNPLGKCPVVVARRPGVDDEARGQFDDVLWVQLARARFAALRLEAATDAVEAPLALPQDVQELALGPKAVLRSATPEKIGRVPLNIPQAAFAEDQQLEHELRVGARYPEGRSGNIDASIVTGRGVQALMGGFDTQVKTAQDILSVALREVIGLCFELDEKLWPDVERTIRGTVNGGKYEIRYKPSRDISGDCTVDVDYGLMAGLDPNRALVFGLQARGDKLISRDFLRRNLPFDMNVSEEEQRVDVEEGRDALLQAIAAYAQSIPVMAQQGMDPSDALSKMAAFLTARKGGATVEDAISAAFPPPQPPPGAETPGAGQPGDQGAPGSEQAPGGAGDIPFGMQPNGLPRGVAPGQADMGPGGRPSLQMMLAGLSSSGKPNLSAAVSRRMPV